MPTHQGKIHRLLSSSSTDKQGKSGLGLEAQKEAVQQRLNGGRWQIVGEFVEIESGKRVSRPQLDAALAACKKQKAKLIVAKLDRLSRNVAFLLKLIDAGVEVLFGDLPELNGAMGKFVLITMANVAELEVGLISERTKAALKAAKARGVKLGRHGAEVLAAKYRDEAKQRAEILRRLCVKCRTTVFRAPHGNRAHQAEGKNAAWWYVASPNGENGDAASNGHRGLSPSVALRAAERVCPTFNPCSSRHHRSGHRPLCRGGSSRAPRL